LASIKEFDSVTIACQYTDGSGRPLSIEGVDIKSEMRSVTNKFIDNLEVTVSDEVNGLFHLRPTLDRLPVGQHRVDVLFIKHGFRISSETFYVSVSKAVTQGVSDA